MSDDTTTAAGGDAALEPTNSAAEAKALRALIDEVEALNHAHLVEDLKDLIKAKKGSLRFNAGTYTVRIGGVTGTSTVGETHAVTNWANRARRTALAMEG